VDGPFLALVILALPFVLLFVITSRARRAQREQLQLQYRVQAGQEVMTTSGLFARVVGVEEDVVVLETSPGQRSRWDRRAVARILDPSGVPEPEGSVPGGPGPADGQTENRSPASPRSGDARSGGTIPGGAEAPQDEPPSSATPPPGN